MEFNVIYIVTVLVIIFISMTIHEVMHGVMSYWLGDDTAKSEGRLSLNPLKHIDPFMTIILPLGLALVGAPIFGGAKPVPFDPNKVKGGDWGAALVAIAGPLTNFVIAFVAFGLMVLFQGSSSMVYVLSIAVSVNLGFFVFNMIPIPPLDGSRVLYALAPEFIRRGMEAIEQMGVIVIFAIVLLANGAIGAIMSKAIQAILQLFGWIFGVS